MGSKRCPQCGGSGSTFTQLGTAGRQATCMTCRGSGTVWAPDPPPRHAPRREKKRRRNDDETVAAHAYEIGPANEEERAAVSEEQKDKGFTLWLDLAVVAAAVFIAWTIAPALAWYIYAGIAAIAGFGADRYFRKRPPVVRRLRKFVFWVPAIVIAVLILYAVMTSGTAPS